MTVAVVIVVVIGILAVGFIVLVARRQGRQSTITMHTEDQVDQRRVDEELSDTVNTGVEVDGHLLGQAVPEPAGPPPVEGAQWDEVHGRWIHWDEGTGTWVPVASNPSP